MSKSINSFPISARPVRGSSVRSFLVFAVAAALSSSAAGCMLSVEAEVPDVEVTQHDISFEGVPGASVLGDVATSMTFTQERPTIDLPKGVDSKVQAVKVDLIAKSGIDSFDFLRVLRITMAPTDGSVTPVELINYEKPDGVTVGSVLSIPALNPVDLLDQWGDDTADFTLEVAGTLPEQAWSLDMSVHFSGSASYKY